MKHLSILAHADRAQINGKSVQQRAAGRFYTHELIGRAVASQLAARAPAGRDEISILDPFCGDGRLVVWLMEELARGGCTRVSATVWDQERAAVDRAVQAIERAASRLALTVAIAGWTGDTFDRATAQRRRWDVVVTNPPWELLKPDHRETRRLPAQQRDAYVAELRAFDRRLARDYPTSQPSRRFAGWGTNLSRVGTEVALRLTAPGGACGVVCPTSLLADATTAALRRWLFEHFALEEIGHFPAEARLFAGVDVPCCTFVAVRGATTSRTRITRTAADRSLLDSSVLTLDRDWLEARDYAIPVQMGVGAIALLTLLDRHPRWAALERAGLWAGRELDETRRAAFTSKAGDVPFVRSRHVQRLTPAALPAEFLDESRRPAPASTRHVRLAWRDISRPSQARRVHATLLPPGCVTGNSLSVAYFRDDDRDRLTALLGIVSSMPFEFQVRSLLMTNHVSLSVMRATRVPALTATTVRALAEATRRCLHGIDGSERRLEAAVAAAYGLSSGEWAAIRAHFRPPGAADRATLATTGAAA
jgi:Alw26I/Eco31I/Esp3I family type II restriction m6 adenine DNA methyltransferase